MDWLEQIKNAIIGGAVAESPSVMTAIGWKQDKDGNWIQEPNEESQQLAENLGILADAGLTAPTLGTDVTTLIHAIRHPIQTGKAIYNIGKDMLWFLKNPRATKVYHANRQGNIFDLRNARTASRGNIGIHVTPHKEISETFNKDAIMEAYIPRHNAETIDIGANNYNLLNNNKVFDARQDYTFYDASGDPKLFYNLLKKYGANPKKVGNKIYTENRVTIPLRNETFPNLPNQDQYRIDEIIKEGNTLDFSLTPQQLTQKHIKLNQEANDILSKNNIKVIKYTNTNPMEVRNGNGISYIVTDPSVFYNPKTSLEQIFQVINFQKYPFIYVRENN